MRMRIGGLLALVMALVPAAARAQFPTYEVPPSSTLFPGPLGHPRYEEGGFFVAFEFMWWHATNPIGNQPIAVRGFVDAERSVSGFPGQFIGSGAPALNANQVGGPGTFQPGTNIIAGWRFDNGAVIEFSWIHLLEARYTAGASLVPPNFAVGSFLENSFLFSPVYNFPAEFGGPKNLNIGRDGGTFGIWNAASLMTIEFLQRFDQFDLTGRIPVWQNDELRCYGLIGPRIVGIWERFKWRTVDADFNSNATAHDAAIYTNIVSNRLYGVDIGAGSDWYLGTTPIGAFSVSLDGRAGLFVDFVKERAKYELQDRTMTAQRARNVSTLAPMLEAKISGWWYPFEAIQIHLGYNFLGFFNTIASREPVDFNFGSLTPAWDKGIFRLYHGLEAGIAFIF